LPDPAPGQLMAIVKEGVEQIASQQEKASDEELQYAKEKLRFLTFYGLGALLPTTPQALV
jgi:hypothetical protein